jgi:hypothetical protein
MKRTTRLRDLPPAKKGFLLLLLFSLIFAGVFALQTVQAETAVPEIAPTVELLDVPPDPPAVEEDAEPPRRSWLPVWGFCIGEESCAQTAQKIGEGIDDRLAELAVRETEINAREVELTQTAAQLKAMGEATELATDVVMSTAERLHSCATKAVEAINVPAPQ